MYAVAAVLTQSVYSAGSVVTMVTRVMYGGRPVVGARVKFDALKPNKVNHVIEWGTTDSNGYAKASFQSGTGPSSIGTYYLTTTAEVGELSSTGKAQFTVR